MRSSPPQNELLDMDPRETLHQNARQGRYGSPLSPIFGKDMPAEGFEPPTNDLQSSDREF